MQPTNTHDRDQALELWRAYRLPSVRDALLGRFDGVFQAQANRWTGAVPREVLLAEARLLAPKAFDSFDPARGVALWPPMWSTISSRRTASSTPV